MQHNFQNKVAILTGAGQGIGLRIAEKLAAAGAHVLLNDVDADRCEQAAQQVRQKDTALPWPVMQVILILFSKWWNKRLHYMENLISPWPLPASPYLVIFKLPSPRFRQGNAGEPPWHFLPCTAFIHSNEEAREWRITALHLIRCWSSGPSATGRLCHEQSRHRNAGQNLVAEISAYGINVNTIAPGATLTERTLEDKEYTNTWSRITPMGRPATVDDIAHAALFLVSDEARHITGQSLVIDGGWTSMSPSPY